MPNIIIIIIIETQIAEYFLSYFYLISPKYLLFLKVKISVKLSKRTHFLPLKLAYETYFIVRNYTALFFKLQYLWPQAIPGWQCYPAICASSLFSTVSKKESNVLR